ncbi:putative membrane protein [Methylobacterium sp. PvR107]|nr:putative membrane protein [Methylobacterium sp. PvR107]
MGPRLLRNFIRDARNQTGLGIFLGTFAYSLMVLRTVRTVEEEPFVPHLAITGALVMALVAVGTLVWFVHHIATSINIETVVDAVQQDLCRSIAAHTRDEAGAARPDDAPTERAVAATVGGYVQALDEAALADWAHERGITVTLRVRPGDYVPSGFPVAFLSAPVEEAEAAILNAVTLGRRPAALQDLEYSVRQLVEIAARALSPGINDPFTAGSVVDHLGDALCRIAPRNLPTGVVLREGRPVRP